MYVRLSLVTKLAKSELMTWEPEAIASAFIFLDEQRDAEKDAARGRG